MVPVLVFTLDHMEISGCAERFFFPAAVDVFGVGGRVPPESSGCLQKVSVEHFTGPLRLFLPQI